MDYDEVVQQFVDNNIYRDLLHSDNYFMQHMALFYLLNIKQRELDESLGLFSGLGARKYVHNFYNIVALPSSKGPFAFEYLMRNTGGMNANCLIGDLTVKMTVAEVE
jgi:hypothetical protein